MPPVSNISPFSYRDGATYLEILYALRDYINITLRPEFDTEIQSMSDQLQAGISNAEATVTAQEADWVSRFNAYMVDVNASLQALNDTAMGGLINTPGSATATALAALYGDTALAAEVDNPASALSMALAALYAGKNDVAALDTLTTTGRLSQGALDAAYVNETDYAADKAVTATATAGMNTAITANTATGAANKAAVENNGFLIGTFLSNGAGNNGSGGEKLALFYSPDGKNVLGGVRNPAYVPADGKGVRDPSITYQNGKFYLAHTSNGGADKVFEIASSPTGAAGTWTLVATISGASIGSMVDLWAPEWVIDTNGDVYIFYASVDANNHGSVYWIKATDATLGNYTPPTKMVWAAGNEPVHYIDPAFTLGPDGKWYFFYSTGTDIGRANCATLTGTWTNDRTGNWAGWGTGIEGIEVVKDGTVYRAWFDRFQAGTGYAWSESADLNTWTPPVSMASLNGAIRAGETLRHGTFYRLTDRNAANKAIASQSLPGPVRHAELYGSFTLTSATPAFFDGVTTDNNETLDQQLVTWTQAGQTVTLNPMALYAVECSASIAGVTGVTRSYLELVKDDNTTVHMRAAGGAEDNLSLSMPNFKPRAAGENIKFRAFFQWSGGQTPGTVTYRIRITEIKPM